MFSKVKVTISGYYGMNNFGDDIFVRCGFDNISSKENISAKILSSPFFGYPKNVFWARNERLYNSSSLLGKIYRGFVKIKAHAFSDFVIYCGGSIFSDISLARRLFLRVGRFFGTKYGAISVSIGPFKSGIEESKVIKHLMEYDFLTVRDLESFNRISTYKLPYLPVLAADVAALFPHKQQKKSYQKSNKVVVGIALCSEFNMSNEAASKQKEIIYNLKNKFDNEKYLLVVFSLNGHHELGDKNISSFVGFENVIEYVDYNGDLDFVIGKMLECDLFITSRLHGAIISYVYQIPFLLFEYHDKCTDFLNYIGYSYRLKNFAELDEFVCFMLKNNVFSSVMLVDEYNALSKKNFLFLNENDAI